MLSNVKDELNRFAKYVISQSRANLTKGSKPFGTKNDTKKLYNSLKHDLNVSPNSFGLKFLMEDYGAFLDQGVKGKDPSKVSPNAKIKGQQAPNKSLAYVIASNIYNRGIKPSMFFTKPFKKAFDNLPKDIVEAYKLDVEELIKYTTNGNN